MQRGRTMLQAAGIAILLHCCAVSSLASRPVELTPTIMLLGEFDWAPHKGDATRSRCTDMVDRALKYGSSRLNFVPTHYYKEGSNGILGFCYMDSGYSSCVPFSEAGIRSFRAGLELCLRHAAAAGVQSVAITPHIDSASSGKTWTIKSWRNGLVFGPVRKYGGYSYAEVMLEPIADAAGTHLPASMPLYLALQGEMGATVFRYPKDYRSLIGFIRERVQRARQHGAEPSGEASKQADAAAAALPTAAPPTSEAAAPQATPAPEQTPLDSSAAETSEQAASPYVVASGLKAKGHVVKAASGDSMASSNGAIKLGLTFNFIFIDGNQAPDNKIGVQRAFGLFGAVFADFLLPFYGMKKNQGEKGPAFDKKAVQALFGDLDFVGISAYAPLKVDFPLNQLQDSAACFLNEASAAVGVDLLKLSQTNDIELHYAEYGVGGGTGESGSQPEADPADVAAKPYWGVFGPYKSKKDPWQNSNARQFMHYFWTSTMTWLRQGTGPTYKITACYIWNLASWDVLGVYPESTTSEGTYRDDVIAPLVAEHNRNVRSSAKDEP